MAARFGCTSRKNAAEAILGGASLPDVGGGKASASGGRA